MGSLEKVAPKVIESTRHVVKTSTAGVANKSQDILGGIGGIIQWCNILLIILPLVCVNRSTFLKICQRKTSDFAGQTAAPSTNPLIPTATFPPKSSTSSHPPQAGSDNPTSTPKYRRVLRMVLASFTLQMLLPHKRNLVWTISGSLTTPRLLRLILCRTTKHGLL